VSPDTFPGRTLSIEVYRFLRARSNFSAASAGKIAFQPVAHYDINAALIKREGKGSSSAYELDEHKFLVAPISMNRS
jgi:hypothetical protein